MPSGSSFHASWISASCWSEKSLVLAAHFRQSGTWSFFGRTKMFFFSLAICSTVSFSPSLLAPM